MGSLTRRSWKRRLRPRIQRTFRRRRVPLREDERQAKLHRAQHRQLLPEVRLLHRAQPVRHLKEAGHGDGPVDRAGDPDRVKPTHPLRAKVQRFHRRPQSHQLKEAKAGNDPTGNVDPVKRGHRPPGRVLLLHRQLQEGPRLNEANAPAGRVHLGNGQNRLVGEYRQLPRALRREESVAGRVGEDWRRPRRPAKLGERPLLPRQPSPLARKEDDQSAA